MDKIEVKANLEVDPKLLAQMFWAMGSEGQAEFFNHLGDEVTETYEDPNNKWAGCCGPFGDGQWWHLGNELRPTGWPSDDPNARGRSILMSMAAPLYLHTINESSAVSRALVQSELENRQLRKQLEALLEENRRPLHRLAASYL